ncbi:Zinc ribbon domain-containing protein [Desulfonema magnum]|uniref:Zinc ribbon domain-containing protein n=2 Tax=Desulfonema magnum TaxID=45655 RepID=A0A975BGP6_9BACT|nr:zinc ribbon domain-containing protein [Desulfonema magnum]QTA85096.1 Zinc ribbon domain-containing protein [Desulfonema magnum]
MAFETKEQVLERIMEQEKPKCPHCGAEMHIWEVPPITFSDGLGWGTPYLFLCFNDDCPLYVEGWENLQENFGQTASYRCMCYPGTDQFECMPVFSPVGAQGQIIDDEVVLQEEVLKENIKKGFSILADCYVGKDGVTILNLLLDPGQPARVRVKAAEMIGDIGELEAIEPLRNKNFGNELIQKQVEDAVKKIHERFFTRECPFCAEIIKKRANICKHCGKEVAGQ